MRICDLCRSDKEVHVCSIDLGQIPMHVQDMCLKCRQQLQEAILRESDRLWKESKTSKEIP